MNYLKSFIIVVTVSLLGGMLEHTIAHTNLAMLYILVVVFTAVKWGRGPSLFSGILSVLILDFFFIPPRFSMTVADAEYLIAFVTLFIVAMVISTLTLREKAQALAAQKREAQTAALYQLLLELSELTDIRTLPHTVTAYINQMFNAESYLFIPGPDNQPPDQFPQAEIDYCLTYGAPVGRGTEIMPSATAMYLPLITENKVSGVLGLRFKDAAYVPDLDQYRLLKLFTGQIVSSLERLKLIEEARQAALLRETEKLHTAFLNSISHDLRTPLASITGSLSNVLNNPHLNGKDRDSLVETAYEESTRLNHLVGELLDMARVEAGALQLGLKPADIRDLVGAALKPMQDRLKGFKVLVTIPDNLPEIRLDYLLMMKVLTYILDNAVKYSTTTCELRIEAGIKSNVLEIRITDRGIGIPPADLKLVFDKFYRVKRLAPDTVRPESGKGTGLGLSVCKGIIEAHHGTIRAENALPAGTTMVIQLPLPEEN